MARTLHLEGNQFLGIDAALALIDVRKFYASIDLTRVFRKATATTYQIRVVMLAMVLYLFARVIRAQGWVAPHIYPGASICAGEGAGTDMAKIMLYDVLADYHARWSLAPASVRLTGCLSGSFRSRLSSSRSAR